MSFSKVLHSELTKVWRLHKAFYSLTLQLTVQKFTVARGKFCNHR